MPFMTEREASESAADSETTTIIEIKGGSLHSETQSHAYSFCGDKESLHGPPPSPHREGLHKAHECISSSLSRSPGLRKSWTSSPSSADDFPPPTRSSGSGDGDFAPGYSDTGRRPHRVADRVEGRGVLKRAIGRAEVLASPGPGPHGDTPTASASVPQTSVSWMPPLRERYCERVPEAMGKMLKGLSDPLDLAPLLRYVIVSADKSSRHFPPALVFKSSSRMHPRVPKSVITMTASRAPPKTPPRVQVGRRKQETVVTMMPTFRLEPRRVASWRCVRQHALEVLAAGLQGVRYSSWLAENGSRILAAAIVQKIRELNYERYRLAVMVRIAQKLNQGMSTHVASLWDDSWDRFSFVTFENSSVVSQAIVFLVYRD